jgi:hypothetical protein
MADLEQLIEKLRQLPPQLAGEVLDYIEFLELREERRRWVTFDEWAMNLARERGVSHLTEEDVAEIVQTHRRRGYETA